MNDAIEELSGVPQLSLRSHLRDVMAKWTPQKDGVTAFPFSDGSLDAVRDSESFSWELTLALKCLKKFSRREATLLVEACGDLYPLVLYACTCAIDAYGQLRQVEAASPGARPWEAWQLEFIERLRRLTTVETLAVLRAAEKVRCFPAHYTFIEALVAVDLMAAQEGD